MQEWKDDWSKIGHCVIQVIRNKVEVPRSVHRAEQHKFVEALARFWGPLTPLWENVLKHKAFYRFLLNKQLTSCFLRISQKMAGTCGIIAKDA